MQAYRDIDDGSIWICSKAARGILPTETHCSLKEEVDGSSSLQDYLRGNFFWSKLLANYTRSPRDRKYLRELLGPLIHANIIEDPSLDLESDPMQIYRSAINNEELRTGQPSQRPLDIPRKSPSRTRRPARCSLTT